MYRDFETTDFEDIYEGEGDFEGMDFEGLDGFGDFEEESDYEQPDPFLGGLARSFAGPAMGMLRGLAQQAAGQAGRAIAGPRGANIARGVANSVLSNLNFESTDFEEEAEALGDFEAIGGDTQVLQEMAHLASLAAEAENAGQSDQFLGGLAGLAGKLIPQLLGGLAGGGEGESDYEEEGDEFFPALLPLAAQALPMAMPLISKGIGALGKLFSRRRRTRESLMETLPVIAAKSVTSLAKQAQAGKPINRGKVAAIVARQTAKTLASKPAVANAVQANKEMAYGNLTTPGGWRANFRYSGQSPYSGYQQPSGRRRRRIIRPRYCVY
jgi:hypothetical protein